MDPDGAPTPVAPTRILAPQTLMSPIPAEVLGPGIQASALMAKYGQEIDRDSAHEILARKLEEGARQAQIESDQAEEAKRADQAARQQEAAQRQTSRSQPRARRPDPTLAEQVMKSSVFKQAARTATREIVRSIFGTGRRR